jgi:hypothetical protein
VVAVLRASNAANTVAAFLEIGALSAAHKGEACDASGVPEVAEAAAVAAASVPASASCLFSLAAALHASSAAGIAAGFLAVGTMSAACIGDVDDTIDVPEAAAAATSSAMAYLGSAAAAVLLAP